MTRIIRIETCDAPCPHAVGTRGCRHPDSLWNDDGITRIRPFEDFPLIPHWCPLEQVGPDWRPGSEGSLHNTQQILREALNGLAGGSPTSPSRREQG